MGHKYKNLYIHTKKKFKGNDHPLHPKSVLDYNDSVQYFRDLCNNNNNCQIPELSCVTIRSVKREITLLFLLLHINNN